MTKGQKKNLGQRRCAKVASELAQRTDYNNYGKKGACVDLQINVDWMMYVREGYAETLEIDSLSTAWSERDGARKRLPMPEESDERKSLIHRTFGINKKNGDAAGSIAMHSQCTGRQAYAMFQKNCPPLIG